MATVIELERGGQLHRLDAALGPNQMEVRRVYVFPRVRTWMEITLPTLQSYWGVEPHIEQLDAFMEIYASGERLSVGKRIKCLTHLSDGIWELKTPDLRMFGWFPQRDCFIMSDCNDATIVKQSKLYRPYCEQAVRFRNGLPLDEPQFLPGDDPNVVVSNCY